MSARHLPLVLLALVAALAAGLWLATHRGGSPERDHGALRPAIELNRDGEGTAPADLAELPEIPDPIATAAQTSGATEPRRVASTEHGDELARAWFVEGRVAFPTGTPPDERVKVVAKGKKFEHGPLDSVAVGPDGRFRVAFSQRTQTGELELEARYLYIDGPVKVAPGQATPVVLEARLGGVLAGRVLPPPGIPGAQEALVGKSVRLYGGVRSRSGLADRSAELDASLTFTFNALPTEAEYFLYFDPLIYEQSSALDVQVEAGAGTTRDLPVLPGVSVSGRLVDGEGVPVARAKVEAQTEGGARGPSIWRMAMTAQDGTFALQGLSPGAITLSIEANGFTDTEAPLGRLERGAQRAGIELKLARGRSISGRVSWPDGSPAAGATVSATPMGGAGRFDAGSTFKSDATGAFTIQGLKSGPHWVNARATRSETVLEQSRLLGRPRERTVRTTLRASASSVEPGATEVVLALSPGLAVAGSVLDDLGLALDTFSVTWERVRSTGGAGASRSNADAPPGDARTRTVKGAGGAFELEGLEPGTYRLEVRAEGHLASSAVEFAVPGEGALAPIRLTRAARITGRVLTPDGEAAPGAEIQASGDEVGTKTGSVMLSMNVVEGLRARGESAADGRFDVSVDPRDGPVRVRAGLDGHACTEIHALALVPGQTLEGVTLQLRPGAVLTGVVLDQDGQGWPGRRVEVLQVRGSVSRRLESGSDGRFEVNGLDPGSYIAAALPSDAEVAAVGVPEVESTRDVLTLRASVEVTEDGGHVVLAAAGERPVRLFGTITASGRPTPAVLMIEPEDGENSGRMVQADADGAYSALVPGPGGYRLKLYLGEGGPWISLRAWVEGPAEQRLDLEVPVGSLAGRVDGPDGPLGGVKVMLQRESTPDGSPDKAGASALTDEGGRYEVLLLPAGTWSIRTPGKASERAKVEGVVVSSGQRVDGVDLHLRQAGAQRR